MADRNPPARNANKRRTCSPSARPDPPVRTLRSPPSSALIEGDGSRPPGCSRRCRRSRSGFHHTQPDPLDGAPIVVSIERTKPGSPLDEHLRREQTQALLDLLADHVARQQKDH
jgi:hypothetical protein